VEEAEENNIKIVEIFVGRGGGKVGPGRFSEAETHFLPLFFSVALPGRAAPKRRSAAPTSKTLKLAIEQQLSI
jgi:hypothetical protein